MTTYKINAECLSPIHIGSGETIDKLEYFIDSGMLGRMNLYTLGEYLTEEEMKEVDRNSSNLGEIEKIYLKVAVRLIKAGNKNALLYTVNADEGFIKYTNEKKSNMNVFGVNTFIRVRNLTTPFIPGSSVKGALRTGIISKMAESYNRESSQYKFENDVLGIRDAKESIFKYLKISDAEVKNENICVYRVEYYHREKRDILGNLSVSGEFLKKDTKFNFEIRVDKDFAHKKDYNGNTRKKECHDFDNMEKVFSNVNEFYKRRCKEDYDFFKNNGGGDDIIDNTLTVFKEFDGLKKNECIIQLGRWGSFNAKTVDNHRKRNTDKTKNIIGGKEPAGWVKLSF